jgi:type II secretory pathway predicted ATPase ExeA
MYLEQFGLRERPFSHAPDDRFVYLGERHARALAHLREGLQAPGGGVSYLVGASGIGKTTMCRRLLKQVPEQVDVALIPDPVPTTQELLSVVCDQLGVAYGKDAPSLILGDCLFRRQAVGLGARRTAVIVDEAQSLGLDVLEQLHLLSSLEVDGRRLLEIVLIGEPWLTDLLARAAPHPSAPAAGHHLRPLTESETSAYVRHRMTVAGGRPEVFDDNALRDVHRLSSGVPRTINTLCAQALLSAVARQRRSVDRSTVRAAARMVLAPVGAPPMEAIDEAERAAPRSIPRKPAPARVERARRPRWPWIATGGLVLNGLAIGAAVLVPRTHEVVATRSDARAQAQPRAPSDPSPPRQNPIVDERPRDVPPPETTAPTPPAAPPAPAPAPTARPVGSQPAGPAGPAMSPSRESAASAEETPRQRRRRERAELREGTGASTAVSELPPQPQPVALKIDMLVWAAEPRQRMVYVNGHKYVEGQTLENGARLEHIEQDGIVLIQDGQRLRLRSESR